MNDKSEVFLRIWGVKQNSDQFVAKAERLKNYTRADVARIKNLQAALEYIGWNSFVATALCRRVSARPDRAGRLHERPHYYETVNKTL